MENIISVLITKLTNGYSAFSYEAYGVTSSNSIEEAKDDFTELLNKYTDYLMSVGETEKAWELKESKIIYYISL